MPRAEEHCPAQLEAGRGEARGSLLLLLPPVHGDVVVLAKVQPSRPRPWGPRRPLWPGGLSHPESFGKRPREKGPSVPHSPSELGEEHAVSSSLGPPLHEVPGRRGEHTLPGFIALPQDPAPCPAFHPLPNCRSMGCRATLVCALEDQSPPPSECGSSLGEFSLN